MPIDEIPLRSARPGLIKLFLARAHHIGWQNVERYWECAGIKILVVRNSMAYGNVIHGTRFLAGGLSSTSTNNIICKDNISRTALTDNTTGTSIVSGNSQFNFVGPPTKDWGEDAADY